MKSLIIDIIITEIMIEMITKTLERKVINIEMNLNNLKLQMKI